MKRTFRFAHILLCLLSLDSLVTTAQSGNDSAGKKKSLPENLRRNAAEAHRYAALLIDSFDRSGGYTLPAVSVKGDILDSALRYSDLAMKLADAAADRATLGELYKERSRLDAIRGAYNDAHDYFVNAWNISDSINSQNKKNDLSELLGKHDRETRDKELVLHKLRVNNQERALFALFAGLVMLTIIGGLLYHQSRLRKRTNENLLALNNQLEEANQVKARFFGILSHDLRSPVANLLGFLHLLKEDPDILKTEEKNDYHQDISRSAAHLLETMEAMLLWSKEQMDSFHPHLKEIAVTELFAYLQKFFSAERRIEMRFIDPDGLSVTADENYLRVIMQNLTSNALKALKNTPVGWVEWKASLDGGQVLLSVTDNGPGLSREQAKNLFSETSSINARSGFGFHLIRDLARAIQFRIAVQSEPGQGACFTLRYVNQPVARPSIVSE